MSKKVKTIAEIRAEIEALQGTLEQREKIERERIGAEVQRLTGRESWDEIKPLIQQIVPKKESVPSVSATPEAHL